MKTWSSLALVASTVLLAGCAAVSSSSTGNGGLPQQATATSFQTHASRCHIRGQGLFVLPDAKCTPGALNPAVTPATIHRTICVSGWTSTVRPPESITNVEKRGSMAAYGLTGSPSGYEYDHLVPLELGGATNSPANLWPEPGRVPNVKDRLEGVLKRAVCAGRLSLATARAAIATDWVAAYRTYVH